MHILVLGNCCKKATDTFENTKVAVQQMGLDATVENTGEMAEMLKYGVMSTPALVIDGKLMAYGRLLKTQDIISLIERALK